MKLQNITLGFITFTLSFNVFAATIKPPPLRQPLKNDNFAIKKPISFSWDKVSGALKYRLIISKDDKFTRYDAGKAKCSANTSTACFSTTVQSAKFTLPATNPLLQAKSTFYWQVQAIGSGSQSQLFQGTSTYNKNAGEVRPFVVSELLAIPKVKAISSDPQSIAAGESLTFRVNLTANAPAGYAINVDYGEGVKKMSGSGLNYSYTAKPKIVGDEQSFIINIIDSNGEEVDSLGDIFTVTDSGINESIPTPIIDKTPPVVIKPVEPVKTATVPSVSSINVSPSSVIRGNSLTFSTVLSGNLPSGYSVKVDYGNGLFAMTGSGKNYSLNVTPSVSAAYSVGIYDAKNTLKSNSQTGNFSINEKPGLDLISGGISAIIGTPYVTELQASDSNLSLIFMDWGDGASESKTATSGATVSFSHIYTSVNSYTWNATAYDSADATSPVVSKTVTVAQPVVKVDTKPTGTSGYTKIANNGSALSDDAKLGTGEEDWACTKDNVTGRIWEVKTTDGGLRDSTKTYTNYTTDYPKCDWSGCEADFKGKYGDSTNTDGFVTAVNNQTLCGATDWRLPTRPELEGLIYCSDGKYNTLAEGKSGFICKSNGGWNLNTTLPTINATYFPDIKDNYWFLSSSPNADGSNGAWFVYFDYGYSGNGYKSNNVFVRLVR